MAIQRWLGRALAAAVLLVASACAEDMMMPPEGASAVKTYTPHSHLVRLVLGDLPAGTEYEVLARLKAIKGGYGETADVQRDLADNARRIGADAIIRVKTWFAPRAFAWASPHAEGIAIKLKNPGSIDFEKLPGETF